MKNLNTLAEKFFKFAGVLIPGAFIFGIFQFPLKPAAVLPSANVAPGEVSMEGETIVLAEAFFGKKLAESSFTQAAIEKKIEFVSTRKAYPASLAVIQKHEDTIKSKAAKYKVPEDVAIGIGLLENGGSETAKSPAGALGVFQLMPGTARSLGLAVNKNVDERLNPEKNIDAGMRYLKGNYETFGDWGLATWAYHAGEGNVSNALKRYAKANHGITLKGMQDQATMRAYIQKHDITVNKLLSDPAVKQFTKKLKDDSSGYPYKVIATATLFKEAKKAKQVAEK